ncbi:histone-lysine N-methyltransferase ASHH3 isoform X7 [Arachis hypogaea]|uniref:histone-lysine N-methyltransferase ASHH3 isoform X7 n=1 Tax=Arachis hypogaea TaxID=3818 RepID=UPI0011057041|nr:histone-lysine N-methyltransferase ASHH3 isoform X10 [Arachis hypogaea]
MMEEKEKLDSYKVGSLPTVIYIPDFITDSEQSFLLNNIYGAPASKWKLLKNRRLQNWGGVVHEKGLLPQPLPPWLTNLTQKISEESELFPSAINHVLINEYLPNQGIMPHQDGPAYFPVVAILSLGSPVVMDFTPHARFKLDPQDVNGNDSDGEDKRLDDNYLPFSVLLMPRSLLIFKDKAYSDYLHGIKDCVVQCYDGNSDLSEIGSVFNNLAKQLEEPVDFELPDSFTKNKPVQYRSIKRNIYTSKKFKRRFDDGIFCSCTPSPESPNVCGIDCHCGVLLSCCSSACKCGSSCLNKPFQHRRVKKMKLVQTEKCGSGIVAAEDIKRGEFVIEYVGEVIDDKTCEERLWNMKYRGDSNFYLCEINRDTVIDATYKGNKSRYINHSCCPNTEMQKWIADGETRIAIFATRDIQKGEQLTYDYRRFVQFGADQDCHCGAVACRRKLGVQPTKPKMSVKCQVYQNGGLQIGSSQVFAQSKSLKVCIGEVIRIKHLEHVRFGLIKWFNKYSQKHLILFEDGCVEI